MKPRRQEVRRNPRRAAFGVNGKTIDDAIAFTESGHRDYTPSGAPLVSPKGARFRMQVMPETARDPGFGLRPADPNNAEDMNRLGSEYWRAMLKRYGSLPKMFGAYNAGPGRVDRLIERHGDDWMRYLPRETQDYIAANMRRVRGY
jgi:soluble lytic murein transglycosylase